MAVLLSIGMLGDVSDVSGADYGVAEMTDAQMDTYAGNFKTCYGHFCKTTGTSLACKKGVLSKWKCRYMCCRLYSTE